MIIDQLPNLASVQATDEIPVERGTTTYKTTLQKVKALIASLLTKADIGLGNVDNVQQYSETNPPPYPVTSVNGQTGDVETEGVIGTIADPAPSYSGWFQRGQFVFDPNTNTVRFFVVCNSSANLPMAQSLGNIPDPYRPKEAKTAFCIVRMNNNAALTTYIGTIGTDGNIYQNATNAALAVFVVGEYSLD